MQIKETLWWEALFELVQWMFEQFTELLRESVLVSGGIALYLVAVAGKLWSAEATVPNELYLILGTVIGFFFGGKVEQRARRKALARAEARVKAHAKTQEG